MSFIYADCSYDTKAEAARACVYDYLSAGGLNDGDAVRFVLLRSENLDVEMSADGWTLPKGVDWQTARDVIAEMRAEFYGSKGFPEVKYPTSNGRTG